MMKFHKLLLLVVSFFLLTTTLMAQTNQRYYWVGGGSNNNWGTIENWSYISGGAPSMGITQAPANVNTCIFDANSFLNGDSTILIDGAVQCDSLLMFNPTHKAIFHFQGSASLSIYGSLEWQRGMFFYNNDYPLNFNSNRPNESIRSNGVGSYRATFNGSATYTLLDSAIFYEIRINNGTLNTNTNYVSSWSIYTYNTGSIHFANSIIETAYWTSSSIYNITTANSAGSLIRFTYPYSNLQAQFTDIYNNIEIAGGEIFYGTYNKITFFGNGSTNNITSDTLFINDISEFTLYNNSSINDFLQGKPSAVCGGQWKLNGSGTGQVTLAAGTVVDIERALIKDLGFSRSVTAQISMDLGNNSNIIFVPPTVKKTLYWIGNTGNWNDPMNWALTSGGTPANCVPTSFDNVVFDDNSFSAPGQVLTIDLSAYCDSMSWIGNVALQPVVNILNFATIEIYGSLEWQRAMSFMTYGYNPQVNFNSNRPNESIRSNGVAFPYGTPTIFKDSATYTLLDSAMFYEIRIKNGTLNTNANYVSSVTITIDSVGSIHFANSVIETAYWTSASIYNITAANSAGSLIRLTDPHSHLQALFTDIYNNIEITGGQIYNGTYNKITYFGNGTVYNITTDTLLINDISEFTLYNNSTINEFLQGKPSAACGGQWKLNGNGAGQVTLAASTVIDIERALIKDLGFSRSVTVQISIDLGNNSNIIFVPPTIKKTLYWIGNTGDWNNPMNWALTSGGTPANCVPTSFDNVVFDDNSFSAPGQVLTIDLSAYCDSMSWIGNMTLQPIVNLINSATIEIYGSLELQRGMSLLTNGYNPQVNFNSNRPNESIRSNGTAFSYGIPAIFNGSATYTLLDSTHFFEVIIKNGILNTNTNYVSSASININDTGSIHFANSIIEIAHWHSSSIYNITSTNSAGSLIRLTYLYSNLQAQTIDIYNNIEITGGYIYFGTYNKITLLGNSTLNNISETDTLVLSNIASYIYSFSGTVRINEGAYLSGTPCHPIYLQSADETTPAIFDIKKAAANQSNDTLWIDNVYVHGIKALTNIDNAYLKKGNQSPDVNKAGGSWGYGLGTDNNNEGWAVMLPYQSGRIPNWAHDFYIPCLAFELLLTSDNMLATYGATYEWRRHSMDSAIIATTPTYEVSDSATYFLTVNYGNGCTATDNVRLIVTSTYIDSTLISAAICQGLSYTQNNFNESEEGVYYQHLQGTFGCDSIVKLTLRYADLLTDTIRTTICQGGNYLFNGTMRTTSGTYNKMSEIALGCDSLITLVLSVDSITSTINAVICQGDTYNLHNFNENQTGTYQLMTKTEDGCDSLVILNLTVNPIFKTTINEIICEGESYDFLGETLTDKGIYTRILTNQYGCDSIVELTLNIYSMKTFITASICQNTSYYFAGKDLIAAGVYIDTLKSFLGCDSIVELTLSVDLLIDDFEITTTGIPCDKKQMELTANIDNAIYQWNTGETSQSIRISEEGIYSVLVKKGQCQAYQEIEVNCPCKIFIPNTFTPNGDNINDLYIPVIDSEINTFSMHIFDRWGSLIFQTNTLSPWDGTTQNGKLVSSGVYHCTIEYFPKEYPDKKCSFQSRITVVR